MKLAICDDQNILTEELKLALMQYRKERKTDFTIITFSSPDKLYAHMEDEPIDLIFMDLDFGDRSLDGIEWSKRIHRQYPDTLILILTAYDSRYKEGYLVRAFRFMTKPIICEELYDNLDACLEELYARQDLTLLRLGVPHKISLRNILYLSALTGGSEIWTETDTFLSEHSLLYWEEQLPPGSFFRCHKSYILNLWHVERLEKQTAVLSSGEKLPVSRRKWTALRTAFIKHDVAAPPTKNA
ncbi:MAG: response regulator transcription factor [Lachnospiraceae bacterium]|nr:response regulator transcription factor [Lachnospiraceae bacterium]